MFGEELPLLSIVICTYNRKDILKKCLPYLFNQSLPQSDYEIILVDDGSTDDTCNMITCMSPPENLHYYYKENGGLASARNYGLNHAKGKYIFFTDDDTVADKFLLEEHLKKHRTSHKLVVNGRVNHFSGDVPVQPGFTMQDISFSFFWTTNVSLEKRYLDLAGRFDEDFKEYGWEDLELGLRLRKLGLKSVFHKKALVYHFKKDITYGDIGKLLRQAQAKARSAIIFFKKNSNWRAKLTTGIFFPRIQINNLLFCNLYIKNLLYNILTSQPESKIITPIHNIYLRQLILSYYYSEINKELTLT